MTTSIQVTSDYSIIRLKQVKHGKYFRIRYYLFNRATTHLFTINTRST